MAYKSSRSRKPKQLSLEEYSKIKGELSKSKLKLNFPWVIRACFIVPILYCLFLVIYYVAHLRFLPEH